MPKTSRKAMSAEMATAPVAPLDLEPMLAANQRNVQAMAEAQTHLIQRFSKMNAEMFNFINRRLERDRAAAREMATCKNAQEAAEGYASFAETAMKDYSEEFGVIAGIFADQTREVIEDAQHQVEAAVELSKGEAETSKSVA